jgi:hypothetical protein
VHEPGVARELVLRALRAAGPPHSPKKLTVVEHDSWFVAVSDNEEWTLLEYLPPETCRATINHLCERFKVPKIWFYDPLTVPGEEEQRQPS